MQKHSFPILLALCFVGGATTASHALASDAGDDRVKPENNTDQTPLLKPGFLNEVQKPLKQVFQFTFDGPKLLIDRKGLAAAAKDGSKAGNLPDNPALKALMKNKEAREALKAMDEHMKSTTSVEELFVQIQAAAGSAGSSLSSSNNDRNRSFSAEKLTGRLATHTGSDSFHMTLVEGNAPDRRLEFSADGATAFRIQLSHPNGDLILLRQSDAGRFAAVVMVGATVFAGQSESFAAFYREHRRAADLHVLPALASLGVELVPSSASPEVRKLVLERLSRTPEQLAAAKKVVGDLDSPEFEVREKATLELKDHFSRYQDLLEEALLRKPSLDARARLLDVVAAQAVVDRTGRALSSLELVRDPLFLTALLAHLGPKEAGVVTKQLETITGEQWGTDVAAWREWARKNQK
jgi:hypothetical protein